VSRVAGTSGVVRWPQHEFQAGEEAGLGAQAIVGGGQCRELLPGLRSAFADALVPLGPAVALFFLLRVVVHHFHLQGAAVALLEDRGQGRELATHGRDDLPVGRVHAATRVLHDARFAQEILRAVQVEIQPE
jgi:hypothetical protein